MADDTFVRPGAARDTMSEVRTSRCHCGAVRLRVVLDRGLGELRRCNCSICRRRGVIMLGVPLDRLEVTAGADALTLYEWNTRVAKHWFCRRCGVYTHHRRRSNPDEYAVNLACFEPPVDLAGRPVVWLDGASNSLVDPAGSEVRS